MKKLFWLLLVSAAFAQTTPNLGFSIPAFGTPNWNVPINNNFSQLDLLLSGNQNIPALTLSSSGALRLLQYTGSLQCAQFDTTGKITGTGVACGTGVGSNGPGPTLDNCTTDQTGNSFYNVLSLTNYFFASWQFVPGNASYINCTVFIPQAQTGATIVLDIAANDATAGHTALFQTCDGVINSGTINIGALTCAGTQTFTTTSTAYNRVTLTFNVQSTLSNNSILAVKIATSTSGTQPTANMLVYPHFVL